MPASGPTDRDRRADSDQESPAAEAVKSNELCIIEFKLCEFKLSE